MTDLIPKENWEIVSVCGSNNEQVVAVAVKLRNAGIPTESFYGSASKKGIKRRISSAHNYEVVVNLDSNTVKDMILGDKIDISDDIVADVNSALEGLES